MNYYIGIDGGGTKTEGVLTTHKGQVLARVTDAASNPNDVTPAGAVSVLTSVIRALLEQGGLTENDLPAVSCFGGIAGGINHRDTLLAGLWECFPAMGVLDVRSDIHILLAGELPEGDGACIICGTGSVCFLRRGEELVRIGGWGYLLDSGGSGYDMGRDALEAALRAHDGRGEPTLLAALITDHLGGEAHTRITEIYREGKPYIASCAPLVFAAAQQGDAVATAILRRNARALAELVEAAWRWLTECGGRPYALPVVMGGGISIGQAPMWEELVASFVKPDVPAHITAAVSRPVFGAVVEAARQAAVGGASVDHAALRAAFSDSYGKI